MIGHDGRAYNITMEPGDMVRVVALVDDSTPSLQ